MKQFFMIRKLRFVISIPIIVVLIFISGFKFSQFESIKSPESKDILWNSTTRDTHRSSFQYTYDNNNTRTYYYADTKIITTDDESKRLFTKKSYLTMHTSDVQSSIKYINEVIKKHQGIIVEQITGKQWIMTAEVPIEKSDEVINQIKEITHTNIEEERTIDDKTQYSNEIDSQINNLQNQERELQQLIKTSLEQKTGVEDLLLAYDKLFQVQTDLQGLTNQKSMMENKTQFAQITIQLITEDQQQGFSVSTVFSTAWLWLTVIGQWAITGFIWILVFSPLWIPLVFLTRIIVRRWMLLNENDNENEDDYH